MQRVRREQFNRKLLSIVMSDCSGCYGIANDMMIGDGKPARINEKTGACTRNRTCRVHRSDLKDILFQAIYDVASDVRRFLSKCPKNGNEHGRECDKQPTSHPRKLAARTRRFNSSGRDASYSCTIDVLSAGSETTFP